MIHLLAVFGLVACWATLRWFMGYVARCVAEDQTLLDDPEIRMMMRFVRPRP